jgi:hypothetical protein
LSETSPPAWPHAEEIAITGAAEPKYAVGLTVPYLPDGIGIGVTRHCVESDVRFRGANQKTFARWLTGFVAAASCSLLTCMVRCSEQFSRNGALMNTPCAVGLCAIALVTIPVFPNSGVAQGTSLKDQLVGTWIYVSSTAKRDDGSNVPRPSLQGAVTYTGDGRFHFITTRTDAPKYASGDLARRTYTVDENSKTIHVSIETSTFPNLVGAPNQRRIITSITADEMKFTNPRTPAGLTLEIVWKRAK